MYIPVTPSIHEFDWRTHIVHEAERRIYLSRLLWKLKQQIVMLKRQIRDLRLRYTSANSMSVSTSLAIRLDVTEGVRSAFYETARAVADELSDLLWKTTGSAVIITVDFDHEDNDRPDEEDDDDVDAEIALTSSDRC